jgi:hypothetical protein
MTIIPHGCPIFSEQFPPGTLCWVKEGVDGPQYVGKEAPPMNNVVKELLITDSRIVLAGFRGNRTVIGFSKTHFLLGALSNVETALLLVYFQLLIKS